MSAEDNSIDDSFIAADISGVTYEDSLSSVKLISESHSGFCRIYSAVKDGKRVIIKSLKPEYASSSAHRQLLAKEFDIASGMRHPNIVETYSLESLPALGLSIIMEYIDGLDLDTFLRFRGAISQAEIRHIFNHICSALACIHSRGIIHRDLKPQNILVSANGQVIKIIDFGLAHGSNYLTFDFPGGTRGYCPPEQTTQNQPCDPRSDIYSLGAVMKFLAPKAPRYWKSLADRCMATDINARPDSVTEVLSLATQSRRRSRRNISIAVAMAIIILGIGAAVWAIRVLPSKQPEAVQQVKDISYANELIGLVRKGKVKGADMADNEEGYSHYAAIWNDSIYNVTGHWLSVGFKDNTAYFYLVANDILAPHARDSIATEIGFHNPEYSYANGYWWYKPIDDTLYSIQFTDSPNYQAVIDRVNLFFSRINHLFATSLSSE